MACESQADREREREKRKYEYRISAISPLSPPTFHRASSPFSFYTTDKAPSVKVDPQALACFASLERRERRNMAPHTYIHLHTHTHRKKKYIQAKIERDIKCEKGEEAMMQ